jgi:hypothetical protein
VLLLLLGLPTLGGLTWLAYELGGPLGLLVVVAPFVQPAFSRFVDAVTNVYAGMLRPIVMRRVLTLAVIAAFVFGIVGVGGMLFGTVIGVLVIPGLYYLFARIADGRKLLRDETDLPLSEEFEPATPTAPPPLPNDDPPAR